MNNLVSGRSSSQTSIPDCVSDSRSAKDPAKSVIKPNVNQAHRVVPNYDLGNYHDRGQSSRRSGLKSQESCKFSSANSSSSSNSSLEHLRSSKLPSVEGSSINKERLDDHDSGGRKQFSSDALSSLRPAPDKDVAPTEALDLAAGADADLPVNKVPAENLSDKGTLADGSTETEGSTSGSSDASVENVEKKKTKKKKKRNMLTADCSNTRYEIGMSEHSHSSALANSSSIGI